MRFCNYNFFKVIGICATSQMPGIFKTRLCPQSTYSQICMVCKTNWIERKEIATWQNDC